MNLYEWMPAGRSTVTEKTSDTSSDMERASVGFGVGGDEAGEPPGPSGRKGDDSADAGYCSRVMGM